MSNFEPATTEQANHFIEKVSWSMWGYPGEYNSSFQPFPTKERSDQRKQQIREYLALIGLDSNAKLGVIHDKHSEKSALAFFDLERKIYLPREVFKLEVRNLSGVNTTFAVEVIDDGIPTWLRRTGLDLFGAPVSAQEADIATNIVNPMLDVP